jgi:putative ABC transport system substrate-binding protein
MSATQKGRASALFCFLLGGLFIAAAPIAEAQKQAKIGVTLAASSTSRFAESFRRGLAEHGWVEGKNIVVDYRYAGGRADRYAEFMQDFVKARVDVIVAGGGTVAAQAAKKATKTIPIVMPVAGDPVGAGLVSSLARPGGNITGISLMISDTSAKRVELLKEAFPKVTRVAVLVDPSVDLGQSKATDAAAESLGFRLQRFAIHRPQDIERAFEEASKERAEAIIVFTSAFLNTQRRRIVELVERHRLAAVYDNREYVEAGGLLSYGTDVAELYRTAAKYVDKILRGAKPGDLPIEQPTKFELLVNARAARTLGVELPRAIVIRADQVID